MMENLTVYIPMDQRQAQARGESLPKRVRGTSLFADISGFTPLTEALALALGPRRGAEELTNHLNVVYGSLITEVHAYRGSVIGFSGDAITCWFDGDNGERATACALAMQEKIKLLAEISIPGGKSVTLGMKAAVTYGEARRFLVGVPKVQIFDVITGKMIDTLATAEHQAEKGEVLIDQATADNLEGKVLLDSWRQDQVSGQRFALVDSLAVAPSTSPWPEIAHDKLSQDWIHPWLLAPVYERLIRGQGDFLAELRPSVALFMRFLGIDYDHDSQAESKLDKFIRRVQSVLTQFDGTLIQLTIGDKGSYLYAAFGAPIAHEDDADRAASTAMELHQIASDLDYITSVQIGIGQGRMRTGAYGSTSRRTYGVLGDAVNLGARLMQAAQPGRTLIDLKVYNSICDAFSTEEQPPLQLKGKAGKTTVYCLRDEERGTSIHLHGPTYVLPIVGRSDELAISKGKLEAVRGDRGQILGIVAEAGMGKSRLAAEVIQQAEEQNLSVLVGECQSYGTKTSYMVWQTIWRNFFNVKSSASHNEIISSIEDKISQLNPNLLTRIPLLAPVLNISIPDNELTRSFDAKLRKSSLEALLIDCVREQSKRTPLLIVLEDCHWLDPLSSELLEAIGRAIYDLPVIILLAFRPLDTTQGQSGWKELPHYDEIPLQTFSETESHALIRLKLDQSYRAQQEISSELENYITKRAEGNPFYIEEIINYLRDQGIDPSDEGLIKNLDLPSSLHRLILTRFDQRTESQKITLKLASVIGRQFQAVWLWDCFEQLGDRSKVKSNLEVLSQLDITALDTPEPDLQYIFKHLVTQEVAYESLPYSRRAQLHNQLGEFIECCFCDNLETCIYLLAHHYERSDNEEKKCEYLLKAGELAQANYANQAAIDYYERALEFQTPEEQIGVLLKLGKVLGLVGEWQRADQRFDAAVELAEELQDTQSIAWGKTEKAELLAKQGKYQDAENWLQEAHSDFESINNEEGVGQVLHTAGTLHAQQANFDASRRTYQESLEIRRKLGDQTNIANLLNNLGIIARLQDENELSISLYEESLSIRRELEDKCAIGISLNNLGNIALQKGDYETARSHLEEAVALQREVGDRFYIANAVNNLGNVARAQSDYELARSLYHEALSINQELGALWAIAYLLEDIGMLAALQGQPEGALTLVGAASALRNTTGAKLSESETSRLDEMLISARQALTDEEQNYAWEAGGNMAVGQAVQYALAIEQPN